QERRPRGIGQGWSQRQLSWICEEQKDWGRSADDVLGKARRAWDIANEPDRLEGQVSRDIRRSDFLDDDPGIAPLVEEQVLEVVDVAMRSGRDGHEEEHEIRAHGAPTAPANDRDH